MLSVTDRFFLFPISYCRDTLTVYLSRRRDQSVCPCRYCRLFDSVLHTNIVTHNNTALHSDALDDAGFSGDHSAPDPKLIIHVYHMIAAMDGVYEFISEYHEDWRSGLRNWLLRYALCGPALVFQCWFLSCCQVAFYSTC